MLKWPNDVLLGGEKLVGMLLESHDRAVAIGIGVNIASAPPVEKLEPGARPATALAFHLQNPPDPATLLGALDEAMRARLAHWAAGGFAAIREDWLARAVGLGEQIVARAGNQESRGVFRDVDVEGALVLEIDGARRRIFAADIFVGEPASASGASAR